jgi:hypothetical protein
MSAIIGRTTGGRVRGASVALLGTLALLAWTPAYGQGSAPPEPDGYTQYWPGACVQAMQRSRNFYWRAREDTAEFTLARDTLLDDVRRVARDCASRFASTAATLAGSSLVPLAQVLLAAGDDAGARQAIDRRLAEPDMKATAPRAWMLAQVVEILVDARPVRMDAARAYLAQLDALKGPDAAPGQVRAWLSVAERHEYVADDAAMRAASEEVIKAGKRLNEHDRQEFSLTVLSAYRNLAEAEADRTGDAPAPRAVLARATADLGKLPRMANAIASYDSVYSRYGTKGPAVVGDLWVGAPGDTVHPLPGKLTVLNFRPSRWTVPATRRLARAAGDSLDVAMIYGTVGYFRGLGPLTMGAEVPEVRKYFFDELKISNSLAITETKYHRLPDSRRVSDPNANDTAYRTSQGTSIVVLDRKGVIRRIWQYWSNAYEPRIAATLRKYK